MKSCKVFFLKQKLLYNFCLVRLRSGSVKANLTGKATVWKFESPHWLACLHAEKKRSGAGNKSAGKISQCCRKKWNSRRKFLFCGREFCVNKAFWWRICTQNLLCSGSEKSECQSKRKRCPWQPSYMAGLKFNYIRNKTQSLHVPHRETSKWRKDACSPNFVTQAVLHQPRREKQTSCPKSWLTVHRVVVSATGVPGSKQGGRICHLSPPPQGRGEI